MSFGRRLILFFLLIVVLPMLAVAGLLLQVTAESRTGKADARLAAGLDTALAIAGEQTGQAEQTAAALGRDPRLAKALRSGRPAAAMAVAERLAKRPAVTAVLIEDAAGRELARAGRDDAIEFARVQLHDPGSGASLGTLGISTTTAPSFAQRIAQLTGREAVVIAGGRAIGGTVALSPDSAPSPGSTADVKAEGHTSRARTLQLTGGALLVLLAPNEGGGPKINLGIALLLALLFAAAVAFAFFLARTLHALHELTSQQAITDELTGLSNQRRFRELLTKETGRAKRFSHDLSLLMLDLDDFKSVNDSEGHLQGDAVLEAVAEALRDQVREVDEPARYGGEEFAVALPETAPPGAAELAERIRARVEEVEVARRSGGGTTGITVSIGVAGLGGEVSDAEDLIAAADEALYAAKRAGKNQVRRAPQRRRKATRRRTDRRKPR